MSTNQAYNMTFARLGRDVTIWPLAKIISPETISIGDSVIIDDFVLLMGGQRTQLGSFIHIGSFSSVMGGGEFIMEDFSGMSGGVRIYTANEDYSGDSLTNPAVPARFRFPTRSHVHLKKFATIGANAVVLCGVTVGEGAVVGANAVITKDCEPWTVYLGNPARPVAKRPSERMLALEQELRRTLYDHNGNYIPRSQRMAA
jgi:acetyltransferase-like isoleucine patch superfamily enzyme